MKNILVTGGAGFIGSNFIFYMFRKHPDYRIVCIDALTYAGNLSTLKSAAENKNFRFVKADITDREAVYQLFEEESFTAVVNFAAESHVDRSIEDPGVFLQTVQTDKFKTGCISLNFLRPLCREEASLNALLPSVLLRGTESVPDIRQISMLLDELYGATVQGEIFRLGGWQLLAFSISYLNRRYTLDGSDLTAPCVNLLLDMQDGYIHVAAGSDGVMTSETSRQRENNPYAQYEYKG